MPKVGPKNAFLLTKKYENNFNELIEFLGCYSKQFLLSFLYFKLGYIINPNNNVVQHCNVNKINKK